MALSMSLFAIIKATNACVVVFSEFPSAAYPDHIITASGLAVCCKSWVVYCKAYWRWGCRIAAVAEEDGGVRFGLDCRGEMV
jgi:hypothetical protein